MIERVSHFRFWIFDFGWSDRDFRSRIQDRAIMYFSLDRKSAIEKLKLLNDPIRPRQHLLRNRQIDLLSGFEIDEKLKFRWLLHCKVGGLGAFENLNDVISGAPP